MYSKCVGVLFCITNVVQEVHQSYTDHSYTESCNITGRPVWSLLANAVLLTVIAAQASGSYFRNINLLVLLLSSTNGGCQQSL